MAARRPTITDIVTPRAGGAGKSNGANLEEFFVGTPANTVTATDYRAHALSLLRQGGYNDFPTSGPTSEAATISGGGQTDWSKFTRDYTGGAASDLTTSQVPPTYADVPTGGGGLPASAWVPNPASPGAGKGADPLSIPAAPTGYGTIATNTLANNEGAGSDAATRKSPSASSTDMGSSADPTLTMGLSPASVTAGLDNKAAG